MTAPFGFREFYTYYNGGDNVRIKEFTEKYGVERREVDYWTNLGLIRYSVDEQNSYRNYTKESEEDIKRIIVIKAMGIALNRGNIELLGLIADTDLYDVIVGRIRSERERVLRLYDSALSYIAEMSKEAK